MNINIGRVSSLEEAIGSAALIILLAASLFLNPFLSTSKKEEEKSFSIIIVKLSNYIFFGYTVNYVVGVISLTIRMIIIRQTYFPQGVDIIVNLPLFVLNFLMSALLIYVNGLIAEDYLALVKNIKASSVDKEKIVSEANQSAPEPVSPT